MESKAIAYIRVSSDKQDNSLQVQEQRIKDYCLFNKLLIVNTLVDENVSGGIEIFKRPAGQKLLNLKGITNIVVIKPDRAFRSVSDALITLDKWNKEGVSLHFADISGASLNTKTAIGKMMMTTIISFAEFERGICGERTKSVLNHKKKEGKIYCSEVFGYDKFEGKLIKNEHEQIIIHNIKHFRDLGYNNSKIATVINERNEKTKTGKTFKGSTIKAIIENPIHNTNCS